MAKIIQQGDILFVPVESIPSEETKSAEKENGYFIVARGEATGHAHKIAENEGKVFIVGNEMFVATHGTAKVVHDEHNTQVLTAQYYKVVKVKEYDYDAEEAREIQD